MLDEPYRWVEAIRNRREYLEDQLKSASPVVACGYENGLLLLTTTPGQRKLFEIYNQVAFAAIGHPADIEKLRKAIIDIAHVEAFNFSARDVSLQRLVNFGLGPLMKTAFDEIFRSPYIARVLVAELDPRESRETFYTIDADGSFGNTAGAAVLGGTAQSADAALARQRKEVADSSGGDLADIPLEQALQQAMECWAVARLTAAAGEENGEIDAGRIKACIQEMGGGGQRVEAAVLDRSLPKKTKFRLLSAEELETALAPYHP
jgi:proteasome alpha subunit